MCDVERRFPDYVQPKFFDSLKQQHEVMENLQPDSASKKPYTIITHQDVPQCIIVHPYPTIANYPKGYLEEWLKCQEGVLETLSGVYLIDGKEVMSLLVFCTQDTYLINKVMQHLEKELNGNKHSDSKPSQAVTEALQTPTLINQLLVELVRLAWIMRSLPSEQRNERLQQLVKKIKESNDGLGN